MNFFSDENTSPNSPPETLSPKPLGLAAHSPRRAQAPQHARVELDAAFERSARALPLEAWSSIVSSPFEDEAPASSALPHSLIVTGLNNSIEASRAIAHLGASFGQVVSVKFHESATATVTFLTVRLNPGVTHALSLSRFTMFPNSMNIDPYSLKAARKWWQFSRATRFG